MSTTPGELLLGDISSKDARFFWQLRIPPCAAPQRHLGSCFGITLMTVLLISCGGGGSGGSQNGSLQHMPGDETGIMPTMSPPMDDPPMEDHPMDIPPAHEPPSTPPGGQLSPGSLGFWADFNRNHFRVEESMVTGSSSHWQVHGTPTGLVDYLPRTTLENSVYRYTGPVWGRAYGFGVSPAEGGETNRVTGQVNATYGPRDHYGPGADDVLNVFLSRMYLELPGGGRGTLPGMSFHGDVGTNRTDPGYDPLLDFATFTLPADQYESSFGRTSGSTTGSFYGANGETVAATFWYRRDGYRIEGAFGAELE